MSDIQIQEISLFILGATIIAHSSFILGTLGNLNKLRKKFVLLLFFLILYPFSTYLLINTNSELFIKTSGLAGVGIAASSVYFFTNFPKHRSPSYKLFLFYCLSVPLAYLSFNPGFWPNSKLIGNEIHSDISFTALFLAIYVLTSIFISTKDTLKTIRENRDPDGLKSHLFAFFIIFAIIASTADVIVPLIIENTHLLLTSISAASSLLFSIGLYSLVHKSQNTFLPNSFAKLLNIFLLLIIVYTYAFSYQIALFIRVLVILISLKVGLDTIRQIQIDQLNHQELKGDHKRNMEFLSDLSHRLKGPLLIAKTKISQSQAGSISSSKTLQEVEQILDATFKTVHNIIQNTKIESGMASVKPKKENLGVLIKSWKKDFHSLAPKHKLRYRLTETCWANIDTGYFLEALTNLIDNARKFSPAGSTITIILRKNPKTIQLTVQDEGLGINQDWQKRIFQRYTQDKSTPNIVGSAGLGLPFVKWVVEQHRGDIFATNNQTTKGASFIITLPVAKAFTKQRKISRRILYNGPI